MSTNTTSALIARAPRPAEASGVGLRCARSSPPSAQGGLGHTTQRTSSSQRSGRTALSPAGRVVCALGALCVRPPRSLSRHELASRDGEAAPGPSRTRCSAASRSAPCSSCPGSCPGSCPRSCPAACPLSPAHQIARARSWARPRSSVGVVPPRRRRITEAGEQRSACGPARLASRARQVAPATAAATVTARPAATVELRLRARCEGATPPPVGASVMANRSRSKEMPRLVVSLRFSARHKYVTCFCEIE